MEAGFRFRHDPVHVSVVDDAARQRSPLIAPETHALCALGQIDALVPQDPSLWSPARASTDRYGSVTKGPWGSALLHSILFQTLVRSFGKTPCPDILFHFRVAHRVGTINETRILLPCHFLSVCVPNVHLPNFLLEFRQGRAAKRTERGVRRHLFRFSYVYIYSEIKISQGGKV